MKKIFLTLGLCVGGFAWMDCDRKLDILEDKIQIAKSYGNYGQVYGLQRAYDRILAKCSGGYGYYGGGYYKGYANYPTANAIDTGRQYFENITTNTQNDKPSKPYTEEDYINESIKEIDKEIERLQSTKQKLLQAQKELKNKKSDKIK